MKGRKRKESVAEGIKEKEGKEGKCRLWRKWKRKEEKADSVL